MMDNLHGILKTLSSEHSVKSGASDKPAPHHLDVFREFLSHLDRVKRAPTPRPKPRKATRSTKR